jgi:Flp pilus assembly protein TadG
MGVKTRTGLRQFLKDNRGNVAIITGLAAIPMFFLAGMGIDYGFAASKRAQLNAYADAAALSAVTPTMMAQSTDNASAAARNTFTGQASTLSGISYSPSNVNVSIATNGAKRVATVSYTVAYSTIFSGLLGMSTINLTGTSQATAGLAPNIDFYLLLDSSPSMAIAATQDGINTLMNATKAHQDSPNGCAFGCHQTNPSADNLGNTGGVDNYQLARTLNVTLRIDLLRTAAQNLMSTAQTTATTNHSNYRMAINTFDVNFNTIQALTSDLSSAQTAAGNINLLTVYKNNWLTSTNNNNDVDTNVDLAMNSITTLMPNPGSGSNTAGDTPQEVLFIVTDGVEDEKVGTNRQISVVNTALCDAVKNKGIRIAVLYTNYLPLPTDAYYTAHVSSWQPNIGPTLQSCASPGLYFKVSTDGDISAAMAALFQLAVQSAYLSS